ncbi:MAG: hypothetical protein CM15mP77_0940 [Synechococcus sp.]|nr:MAG: hypothetical protein CM15mP77_0940 [Synechococcus sp.]
MALVGPSGAGKSTLFSLLLRFNAAQQGRVLRMVTTFQPAGQGSAASAGPGSPAHHVFSGSIAEAIRFGRQATDAQVMEAAFPANADGFIRDLPEGYNTLLEERGTNLSGGQLQRIAIARAVLGNPAVLLLDEATSALDAEAEAAVQLGLRRAMRGRTVLVIATAWPRCRKPIRSWCLRGGASLREPGLRFFAEGVFSRPSKTFFGPRAPVGLGRAAGPGGGHPVCLGLPALEEGAKPPGGQLNPFPGRSGKSARADPNRPGGQTRETCSAAGNRGGFPL